MRKRQLVEFTPENDIKYRAPFGIVHMTIFAWIFMIIMQIANIINVGGEIFEFSWAENTYYILSLIGELAVPCFIYAAFSSIIHNRSKSRLTIATYLAGIYWVIMTM